MPIARATVVVTARAARERDERIVIVNP